MPPAFKLWKFILAPDLKLDTLLEQTSSLANLAGARILEVYETDFAVQSKDDDSPLTAADLAAHQCIKEGLAELTPELPLLSEESRALPWPVRSSWRTYWLVDPLDGTKEFVKRNGEFTVNIALIHDHEAVLGVVHVPVSGVTYLAARGAGAHKILAGGEKQPISVRTPAATPLRVVGSRSHPSPGLAAYLDKLGDVEMVAMGSSLKFCLVAEGEADIYPRLGPTSEWDTAAAQAVVECAGGRVLTGDGKALAYNCKDDILNPYFIVTGDTAKIWPPLN